MGLMEIAKNDIAKILGNANEFATQMTFTPLTGNPVTIAALGINHNLKYDDYGTPISSKTTRITVSEKSLTDAEYPVRNAKNEVFMIGHKVQWTDVMGNERIDVVNENIAGETNGIIVLILGDYKQP